MCNNCNSPYPCNCIQQVYPCNPCVTPNTTGCTHTWDFSCIIYNKNNNSTNNLESLGVTNGATLKLIIEAINTKIAQLSTVPDWTLTYLRTSYVINTLQQFGVAVDQALSGLQDTIDTMGYLGEVIADPALSSVENGQYFFNTVSDLLKIKLNGIFRTITIV